MLEYKLQFAELILQILSERKLEVDNSLLPFVINNDKEPDVCISLSWDWKSVHLPEECFLGEDLILKFYELDGARYCVTTGGYKGDLACTTYGKDLHFFRCVINSIAFPDAIEELMSILRMFPMREIFVHNEVLFFHASQISYKGKGIIFTAPSGTGKTTQARLWEKYRGADIICNDRTLVRKRHDKWSTYGYPIDGSEPIRSSAVNELGCIVLLEQSEENYIERLEVAKAVANLMPQLVLDVWNKDEQIKVMELLFSILQDCPVYLLRCTKEADAVETLEKVLIESRII